MQQFKEDIRKLVFEVLEDSSVLPRLDMIKPSSSIMRDLWADEINLSQLSDKIYDRHYVRVEPDEITLDMNIEELARLIFQKRLLRCNNA